MKRFRDFCYIFCVIHFLAVIQSKIRKEENAGTYGSPLYMIYGNLFPPLQHSKRALSTPLPAWRARNLSKKKKENLLFAALAKCGLKIPLVLILQTFLSMIIYDSHR